MDYIEPRIAVSSLPNYNYRIMKPFYSRYRTIKLNQLVG